MLTACCVDNINMLSDQGSMMTACCVDNINMLSGPMVSDDSLLCGQYHEQHA